jgi:hypothetical protein
VLSIVIVQVAVAASKTSRHGRWKGTDLRCLGAGLLKRTDVSSRKGRGISGLDRFGTRRLAHHSAGGWEDGRSGVLHSLEISFESVRNRWMKLPGNRLRDAAAGLQWRWRAVGGF